MVKAQSSRLMGARDDAEEPWKIVALFHTFSLVRLAINCPSSAEKKALQIWQTFSVKEQ